MSTFIVAFIILMLVGAGMAIGVIFGRQPIKGSCGGLGAVGVERACGCKDVCENKETNGRRKASVSFWHRTCYMQILLRNGMQTKGGALVGDGMCHAHQPTPIS